MRIILSSSSPVDVPKTDLEPHQEGTTEIRENNKTKINEKQVNQTPNGTPYALAPTPFESHRETDVIMGDALLYFCVILDNGAAARGGQRNVVADRRRSSPAIPAAPPPSR